MTFRLCYLSLLFLVGAARLAAQGGPPMITDDPGTPGDGHWEINVALTTERRASERTTEMPLLDLNYGVGERLQLKYEAAWLRLSDGKGARTGLSNSSAGVKWRFYDAGEKAWSASVYPQLEFNNPGSGSDHRGLAEPGTGVILPVQVMKDFGVVSLNADLGFVRRRDGNEWFGGVVLGREVSHEVELAAELHWEAGSHFHETELVANVGARIAIAKQCTLLVAVGRDLHNHRESFATLFAYLGLQIQR